MLNFAPKIKQEALYDLDKNQKKKYNFLLQKKRKRAPEKSSISKIISELAKKKIRDPGKVKSFLNSKYEEMSEENINLYTAIAGSKVKNGKLVLNEKICKKPLSTDYYFWNLKCKCISNDALYLESLYTQQQALLNKYTQKVCGCGDVSWMRIVSPSYELTDKIQKGYYQDFSENYAFVGLDAVDKEMRDGILATEEKYALVNFIYRNLRYDVYGNNQACMIVPENCTKEDIADQYENMKIISPKKNKFAIEIKSSQMNGKIKFLDTKLHKESFCPAFLYLPIEFTCNVQMHVEYNYNDLFQLYMETIETEDKKIGFPANSFYWDSMDDFMKFIAIMALTMPNLSPFLKEQLGKWYDSYMNLKEVFIYASKIYPVIIDIFVTFYLSFTTKIDYDKLTSMNAKAHDCLNQLEILSRMPEHLKIFNLTNEFGSCAETLHRQLSDEFAGVFKECVNCMDKLLSGSGTNIVEELTEVCKKIYMFTYCNEQGFIGCIPRLLPAGGFLAGIGGGAPIDKDILRKKLKIDFEKKREIMKEDKKKLNMMTNILNHLGDYQEQVVQNTVNKYISVDEPDYEAKRGFVAQALRDGIGRESAVRDMINNRIIAVVQKNGKITEEYLNDKPLIDRYVDLFAKKASKKDEIVKDEIRKLERKIATYRGKVSALKGDGGYEALYDDDDIDMKDEIKEEGGEGGEIGEDEEMIARRNELKLTPILTAATKEVGDFINNVHTYFNSAGKSLLSVGSNDLRNQTVKGGKVHTYLASLIDSAQVYGPTYNQFKKLETDAMLRKYPITYEFVDAVIRKGFPTPFEYFENKKPIAGHKLTGYNKVLNGKINDKDIKEGKINTGKVTAFTE